MPEIKLEFGATSITLKCDKVIERISRSPIKSDLPGSETLAIDLGVIASILALTGFFANYSEKNALRNFVKESDGTDGAVQVTFPHEGNKKFSTMIKALNTDYTEGEAQWHFTLELIEVFSG